MLDAFFLRALLAGALVGLIAAPFGCFVVWRRMAYFGDTIAHAAVLGLALALFLDMAPALGVFAVALAAALTLHLLARGGRLGHDTVLGILAHGALATGLVAVALMPDVRVDLMALLFGDVLAVSNADLIALALAVPVALGALALVWRPLLAASVDPELAAAEGMRPERAELVLLLLLAGVVAVAMKIVGVLLITALLILPAAAARALSARPEGMAAMAALIAVAASVGGLFGSLRFDTPSGPSVVVAAVVLFLASTAAARLVRLLRHPDQTP